jgi:hypothetical protein
MVYNRLMNLAVDQGRTLIASRYTSDVTPRRPPTVPPSTSNGVSPPVVENYQMRPQFARAYRLWYQDKLPLDKICAILRSEEAPLKESTVMSVDLSPTAVQATAEENFLNI